MKYKIIPILIIFLFLALIPNNVNADVLENGDDLFPNDFNFGLYNEVTESEIQFHYTDSSPQYYNLTLNQSYILGIFFQLEVNKDSILGVSYTNELSTWIYFVNPSNDSYLIPALYYFNGQSSTNASRWGYSLVYNVPPESYYINESGLYQFIVICDITNKTSDVNRYYNNYSFYINIEYVPPEIPEFTEISFDTGFIQLLSVGIVGISLVFAPTFFVIKIRNTGEKLKYGTYMVITIAILIITMIGVLQLT